MSYYNVKHQFEVRYNFILDFSTKAIEIIAPYIKLCDGFAIEEENTIQQKIVLHLEEKNVRFIFGPDRAIFIVNGGEIDRFLMKNSVIETIFFSVIEKLTKLNSFGGVASVLLFEIGVNIFNDENEGKISKYLNKNLLLNLFEFNDYSITLLNEKKGEEEKTLSFGPFKGRSDIEKRVKGLRIPELDDTNGIMSEIKHFKLVSSFSFNDYVDFTKSINIIRLNLIK
jgi:hypothetical protein